ncbi:MAG TPA: hypothetical protein VKU90_07945 [Caulobacteraceae bacterium]|nr:hypothetical protein [Caulobacteraceae bacterium]
MRRYLILFAAATLLAGCGKTGNTVSSSGQAASLGSVSSSVTAPASPATAASVAQSFGLIGRWALDCGQPASPDNEYGVYTAAPDGSVGLTYDGGPTIEPNTYTYTAARLVGADAIEIDGVLLRTNVAQHTTLKKNGQGQMKVWGNVDGTGKVLVDQGSFPDGGGPAWESHCPG